MIKPLSVAAAVCALGLFFAPAAYAITNAEADYLQDLHSAGIGGDDAALIADGHTVCAALAAGHSGDSLSQTYYDNAVGLSHAQADAAVNFAHKDLCPSG
jgi:hypothetical protein